MNKLYNIYIYIYENRPSFIIKQVGIIWGRHEIAKDYIHIVYFSFPEIYKDQLNYHDGRKT